MPTARLGVDVSSAQHPGNAPINWAMVAAQGVSWAAVKVSEGTNYTNPFDAGDVGGETSAGIEVVEYHFARPTANNPVAEAQFAAKARGPVTAGRRYALDLEDGAQLGWPQLAGWSRALIANLPLNLIYVPGGYRDNLEPLGFPWGLGVWLADPSGTQRRGTEAVVQIGQATMSGIPAPVDINAVYYPRAA